MVHTHLVQTKWEKEEFPIRWLFGIPQLCIQCGNCSFVCPHAVIRSKFYHKSTFDNAPEGFQSAPINAKGFPETKYTLQVYLKTAQDAICVMKFVL